MARVHILGASGSGTTTLGAALCTRQGWTHFDVDDYFWVKTDPPYTEVRPTLERQAMLGAALAGAADWALSGSMCGWGDGFIGYFDLVVFLLVPTALRRQRLIMREAGRYGRDTIAAGGPRHDSFTAFMAWAEQYDDGPADMRSRTMHEAWLAQLPCPVLRLEGERDVEQSVRAVERSLRPKPSG